MMEALVLDYAKEHDLGEADGEVQKSK